MIRRLRCAAAVLLTCGLVLPASSAAADGPSFSVVTPPMPASARPGQVVVQTVRVSNATPSAVTFEMEILPLDAEDNGRVRPGAPNPITDASAVPPSVAVPARGSASIEVTTRVPTAVATDVYLVGVLVRPRPGPDAVAGLRQNLQIGAHVALDVDAGPADRRLEITPALEHRILLVSPLRHSYEMRNSGTAGLLVRHEVSVRRWGLLPALSREGPAPPSDQVLAAQRGKAFADVWNIPAYGVGVVRPVVTVTYASTDGTETIIATGPLALVIPPSSVALLLGLAVTAGVVVQRRRRAGGSRTTAPESVDQSNA